VDEGNNVDTALWPAKWADTHTSQAPAGRSTMKSSSTSTKTVQRTSWYFAMTEEGIDANLSALAEVGINGSRDMFDSNTGEEI
jgi:hypothetical protein